MIDVAIIGSGPAGLTAAIYAARAGLSATVFESVFLGGQVSKTYEVENYPGVERMSGMDLMMKIDAQAKEFGAEYKNEEITEIRPAEGNGYLLVTPSGEEAARTVILTTGAKPRLLGVPGEDTFSGRGVSYCATCDGAFYRGKRAAVVGGGNTALEDAVFLSRYCETVYLIHRRDEFRADKSLQEKAKAASNIEIRYDTVVTKLFGGTALEGAILKNVNTGEETELSVNGVFVAVGTVPNSTLLDGVVEKDPAGYIITDASMATNLPGVFAAGDARNTPLRQIITAAADGAVAAYSASVYLAKQK